MPTDRLRLPLLSLAQAQKEMTHNEALTLIDFAIFPTVESVGRQKPPEDAVIGQAWVVGTAPEMAWSGQAHAMACMTQGGWRFLSVAEGGHCWSKADQCTAVRASSGWVVGEIQARALKIGGLQVVGPRQPRLDPPNGGQTVDAEARTAIVALQSLLRTHGLMT